jgi:DNA-binding HxlR family transcriptional regulator
MNKLIYIMIKKYVFSSIINIDNQLTNYRIGMNKDNKKTYEYNGKEYICSLEAVMDLLAGKWRASILWHLMEGELRFSEIQRIVPGISRKVLSEHLRIMEQSGLIKRIVFPESPPKVQYNITKKGETLHEPLKYLENWARLNMEA